MVLTSNLIIPGRQTGPVVHSATMPWTLNGLEWSGDIRKCQLSFVIATPAILLTAASSATVARTRKLVTGALRGIGNHRPKYSVFYGHAYQELSAQAAFSITSSCTL